jgi:hypothetical protein
MGADEEGTHERLKALRRELLDPKDRRAPWPHRQDHRRRLLREQPLAASPGERYNYNSGETALLGAVLHKTQIAVGVGGGGPMATNGGSAGRLSNAARSTGLPASAWAASGSTSCPTATSSSQ